ncbi:MAG: phage tail protein [Nostocales cyanobacterium 94392]|nr:phage tail protein [Nostocales cyanobacterium 94392]
MPETGQRNDPFQQFNFLVEIDGINRAGFMECTSLSTETDVIEYREGADISTMRKIKGLDKYAAITLKGGMLQDTSLWNWRKQIINGQVERKSADIILLDESRDEVMRWRLREAWITKWEGGPFNAKTNDVLVETVEIVHEGMEIV